MYEVMFTNLPMHTVYHVYTYYDHTVTHAPCIVQLAYKYIHRRALYVCTSNRGTGYCYWLTYSSVHELGTK